jgi:hypothetical protein
MSGWYLDGKESLLARTVPEAAGVWIVGVNEDYIYDEAHTDFTFITPHILLPEQQLVGVNFNGGILRAGNPTWLAAGAGIVDRSLNVQGVIIYFQLADAGTLLAYIDSAQVGLPQTLTGVDVTGKFASNGILKL